MTTDASNDKTIAQPLLRGEDGTERQLADASTSASVTPRANAHAPEDDLERASSSGSKSEDASGKVTWQMMTFILLGDMFGLGTLTLPADFARLGWLPALGMILICVCGTLYSGRLFTLLSARVPKARVFDDFGRAALGVTGQRLVYIAVYTTILLNPIIFQLTSVECLRQIFVQAGLPGWALGLIVAGIMLPLAQVQGLEDVAALSAIGTVGMLTALVVAVAKFCAMAPSSARTELVHAPEGPNTPIVAMLDIVFTYGGQVNWVRYITQMRVRKHFPRSVAVTTLVMTAAYLVMGAVGYARLGPDFDHEKPITSVVPRDAVATPIMNAGLFAHCVLAYQINMNVWTDLVLHLLQPALGRLGTIVEQPGWLLWGAVSASGIAIAFAVAATFPFFSTVAAIIASLGDLAGAYAMPSIFLLVLSGATLPRWESRLLKTIAPIALLLSAVGLASSLYALVVEAARR